jgi:hypothetical protein
VRFVEASITRWIIREEKMKPVVVRAKNWNRRIDLQLDSKR